MDTNDDMENDFLDNLADKHADLFFWIEKELEESELPDEPSPAELTFMDENAQQLLDDLKENGYDDTYGNL